MSVPTDPSVAIEVLCPPAQPPVVVAEPDDAWMLAAAIQCDSDAAFAVLVEHGGRVAAVLVLGRQLLPRALGDIDPLVRFIELFDTEMVYLAIADETAEPLVDRLAAEFWGGRPQVSLLPPLPEGSL